MYQRAFPLDIKHSNVVFVKIDQKSLDALKENAFISWPWPRSVYGTLLNVLKDAKAKEVLIDLILSSPSVYGNADDSIFKSAIEQYHSVYLPFMSGSGKKITKWRKSKEKIPLEYANHCIETDRTLLPYTMFQDVIKGMGDARGFPDKDGIFRKYPICTKIKNQIFPSFALSIFPKDTLLNILKRYDKKFLYLRFPKSNAFKSYSFIDLISLYKEGKLRNALKGNIVILGATAPGLLDLKPTSISQNTPGMFLHATLIENMRHHTFIRHLSSSLSILFVFLLSIGFYLIYSLRLPLSVRSIALFGFFLMLLALSMGSFDRLNLFISPLLFLLPLLSSYIMFVSYDYMVKDRERRLVKKLFRHYVSESLLEEILRSNKPIKLGGEKKEITIMFSDIASFTSISEKLAPERVVELLNTLLEEMSNIIMDEKGYIDKYEGDAIMAFWNAPVDTPYHATYALSAAIKCTKVLKNKINPILKTRGLMPLCVRFGINTGEAVVGNIGSMKRFDYTAIGDSVNLASRLEGANKVYGTSIIASEFTKMVSEKESPSLFVFRELDMVRVKGKEHPVKIYEVVGFKKDVDDEKIHIIDLYEKALHLYREGAFKEAKKILSEVANKDKVSEVLLKRCLYLIENPPQKWDGIFIMKTK